MGRSTEVTWKHRRRLMSTLELSTASASIPLEIDDCEVGTLDPLHGSVVDPGGEVSRHDIDRSLRGEQRA